MFVSNNTKKLYHLILAVYVAKIAQIEEIRLCLSLFDNGKYLLFPIIRY